jgi:hypothetical protein
MKEIALIDDVDVIKKTMLELEPDQAQHLDSNRYEDDYSQLPAEELCSKHSAFR